MKAILIAAINVMAIAACSKAPERNDSASASNASEPSLQPAALPAAASNAAEPQADEPPASVDPAPRAARLGESVARQQWAKAENRMNCAPLVFADDGGQAARPRAATFAGGWGVAFDLPGLRSAYGVAGVGVIPGDDGDVATQRARLARQWPRFRDLDALPSPAFAGYGLVGAERYPATNPLGTGLHSLAYVRVGGQQCTYNIWSRISRPHLERLLEGLRILPADLPVEPSGPRHGVSTPLPPGANTP